MGLYRESPWRCKHTGPFFRQAPPSLDVISRLKWPGCHSETSTRLSGNPGYHRRSGPFFHPAYHPRNLSVPNGVSSLLGAMMLLWNRTQRPKLQPFVPCTSGSSSGWLPTIFCEPTPHCDMQSARSLAAASRIVTRLRSTMYTVPTVMAGDDGTKMVMLPLSFSSITKHNTDAPDPNRSTSALG